MFTGVVIEESLENKDVLQEFRITDSTIEKVTNKHATPRLSQWTKHTVEIPDDNIDETAEMISSASGTEVVCWFQKRSMALYHL